jgi:hypothetical protein
MRIASWVIREQDLRTGRGRCRLRSERTLSPPGALVRPAGFFYSVGTCFAVSPASPTLRAYPARSSVLAADFSDIPRARAYDRTML